MILERKDNVCSFRVDTISGETFFLDVPTLDLESGYLEVPISSLAIVAMPPTEESKGQPTQGLLEVGKYKGLEDSMYIGNLGIASVSRVLTDSQMGRAITSARSGIIL